MKTNEDLPPFNPSEWYISTRRTVKDMTKEELQQALCFFLCHGTPHTIRKWCFQNKDIVYIE